MNVFDQTKDDVKSLLDIAEEISRLQERLLFITNMNDKINFDASKAEKIREKVSILQTQYFPLKHKLGLIPE